MPHEPHEVSVIAFPGISPFHLAVPSLVFGNSALLGPSGEPEPPYRVTACAEQPGALPTEAGYDVVVRLGLEACERADTVVVPSWIPDREPSPALLKALRQAHARGARIVGLCLGAFPVSAAGLLTGRRAATHWNCAGALRQRHPSVVVEADVLWVDHGDVVTSAGVAAALDCCLHLVRHDRGAAAAVAVARQLVLAPHRDGGQAQFIPVPAGPARATDPIGVAREWALARLDQPLDLAGWARAAGLSRRTFSRQFRTRTGLSAGQWLLDQRLLRARVLLETTGETIERIATAVGFATSASLRSHFATRFGTTPARYRRAFTP